MPTDSFPKMAQPKLLDGLAIQFWTSAIICAVLLKVINTLPPTLLTTDPLTVELKSPPGVLHVELAEGVVAL